MMNNMIREFAKDNLRNGLARCTEGQQLIFKKMYSPKDLSLPINELVNKMSDDKLDWAMQQVERTLKKSGG